MRRDVQLYIAGRQVDLGDDSWILFNWSREVLGNPTSIVNGSSHQVTIPGTPRNNSVFGAVWRLDRRTIAGGYDGTRFDPTRKTPFTLFAGDGSVLESGYVRLDTVATAGRVQSYAVTLFGGLGSMFYALAYDDAGNGRTLADLIWTDADGNDVTDFAIDPAPDTVAEAWQYLSDGTPGTLPFWNVVNFAPCYNGIPADFDARHAISNADAYINVGYGYQEDPDSPYYTYKAGLDCALLTFENQHTEWEVGDLRWYLQRPVVRVKAFIAAICDPRNNGGYTVDLDPAFFTPDNPYYEAAWWTLPMIATDDRASAAALTNCLRASKSPMQYLIDFAKTFGLLFLWDGGSRKVTIVTRATFYGESSDDVIDITSRIDRSQDITQDPVFADSMWYQMGDGGKGEFVEQYAIDYGRGYAVQLINTGYEFDAGTRILTEGRVFPDAAEVLESSRLFATAYTVVGNNELDLLLIPRYEEVTVEFWDGDASINVPVYPFFGSSVPVITWDNADHPGADWLPKVQLHAAEGKAQDGADVLLFFAGIGLSPAETGGYKPYYITADTPEMTDLAGGPCWDLTRRGIETTELPSFRRTLDMSGVITQSYEWGVPAVRPVPDITHPVGHAATIYGLYWQDYLSDLYAADTRVMTCMVDLRGLSVGQSLLRRLFWYQGALWALNAIRNHSVTTDDLTECEFIKVNDKAAYIYGPGVNRPHYLTITPDSDSFSFPSGGKAIDIVVDSSTAWTLTAPSPVPSWLTLSRDTGPSGKSTLTVTVAPNTTTGRRNATVTLTNSNGVVRSFSLMQAPHGGSYISLSPSSISIPASGTSTPGGASRGRSARVDASGEWELDRDTVPAWLTVTTSVNGLSIKADANTSASDLTAAVEVYLVDDPLVTASLIVTQAAGTGGTISITDALGNDYAQVAAAGQTLTLTVHSSTTWKVTHVPSWVSGVAVNDSGGDGDTITAVVASASADRDDVITVQLDGGGNSADFGIYQSAPADTSHIELTRRANSFYNDVVLSNEAQGEGFQVYASGAWTCEVIQGDSWLHPNGSWSSSGNKVRWFDVDAGGPRTGIIRGTLTGTGKTSDFYVYQGMSGSFSANFNKGAIDSAAQTIYLVIRATGSWTITYDSGCTPSVFSGSGDAEVACAVSATSSARTIIVRVYSDTEATTLTATCEQSAPVAGNSLIISPNGSASVGPNVTSLDVSVVSDTSWSVSVNKIGVSLSRGSGSGNATVTATFSPNSGESDVSFTLTFQTTSGTSITRTLVVTQKAAEAGHLTVSPAVVNLSGAGSSSNVTLNSSAAWTASKSQSWINVAASGSAGDGQTVAISAGRNTGAGPRTGTVTFSAGGRTVQVTVNQPTSADLEVSADAVDLPAAKDSTATVSVFASGAWDIWEYTVVPVWLDVLFTAHGGSQSGEPLTFKARTSNTEGNTRTATIRVILVDDPSVYRDITVSQDSGLILYVSPSSASIHARDYDGVIQVTSNTAWRVSHIDEGITIDVDQRSGSGNGVVYYYVGGNPGFQQRTLTVDFETADGTRTATFTVIQAGGMLSTSPASYYFAGSGEIALVKVFSSADWEIEDAPAWITVRPTAGNANTPNGMSIEVEASANAGGIRTGGEVIFRHVDNPSNVFIMQVSQGAAPVGTLTISPTEISLPDEDEYLGTLEIRSSGTWDIITASLPNGLQPGDEPTTDDGIVFDTYSGTGNADVNFTVLRNGDTNSRTVWAKVVLRGGSVVRQLTIFQPGFSYPLALFPDVHEIVFSQNADTFSLAIQSSEGWTLTKNAAWLSVSPVSGNAGTSTTVTLEATIHPTQSQLGSIQITASGGSKRTILVRTIPPFVPVND